jgi:hypothetical protein
MITTHVWLGSQVAQSDCGPGRFLHHSNTHHKPLAANTTFPQTPLERILRPVAQFKSLDPTQDTPQIEIEPVTTPRPNHRPTDHLTPCAAKANSSRPYTKTESGKNVLRRTSELSYYGRRARRRPHGSVCRARGPPFVSLRPIRFVLLHCHPASQRANEVDTLSVTIVTHAACLP